MENTTNFFDDDYKELDENDIVDSDDDLEEDDVEEVEEEEDESEADDSEDANDEEDEEEETETESNEDEDDGKSKSKEDDLKKRNAKYAEMRRQREAEQRAKKEQEDRDEDIRVKAQMELIKKNPYTEEPIKSKEDFEIYKIQKQIDDEGGDPIADLPKAMAKYFAKKNSEAQEVANKEALNREKINREMLELKKAHPEVNLQKLSMDTEYTSICLEKGDRWTMLEVYDDLFTKRENDALKGKKNKQDAKIKEVAKKKSKVPSSSTSKKSEIDYLNMSDEEYLKSEKKDNGDFF